MPKALSALALVFLLAHAAYLPSTFADIDEINFALGVRHFDVASHQPHPPGYPVFIAIAKGSTAALGAAGVPAPAVRGLAIWSAIAGALLVPLLFLLFREMARDQAVAAWAAAVTVVSPLFWFNALRPLSDLTGLAVVVAAQALLVRVILRRPAGPGADRALIAGAFVAGVAIGLRSQSFVLTLPLLALALAAPGSGILVRNRALALAALASGVLLWAVPMVVASGGLEAYLVALGNQAGEDFSGVVMLWSSRSARVAIDAIRYTFPWPWGTLLAGWIVVAVAGGGALRMVRRAPGPLAVLLVGFAPYAIFHLLFQETVTTRYALPLVIPVAFLCVYGLAGAGTAAVQGGSVLLVIWSLAVAVPAMRTYAGQPAPAVRALQDALAAPGPDATIAMHAVMLRLEQWYHGNASGRVMRVPHGREVSALVERWRGQPDTGVHFFARRLHSDLARIDPRARTGSRAYEWGFPELPLLGGVRPGEVQLIDFRPPGWMLGEGWALTAELGGQTERLGAGPHRRPAIVWARSRQEPATLMIGGRNLGPGPGPARIVLASGGRQIHTVDAAPGFFFERLTLPAGALAGAEAYVPLEVTATGGPAVRVSLEQFDLQPDGVPLVGATDGWYEPEFNPATGRTWRWMSGRAGLWVRSIGRDVTLTLSAESPLRYFDGAPNLQVSVGGQVVGKLSPSADFTWEVRIPAALLASGNDTVILESDRTFTPPGADARSLALRVYRVEIN